MSGVNISYYISDSDRHRFTGIQRRSWRSPRTSASALFLLHIISRCRKRSLIISEKPKEKTNMASIIESNAEESNLEVPSEFICPITMELMVHPIATRHGQNFERSAIIAWLRQGGTDCPLTRKPLKMTDLIHNNNLAAKIRKWREINGIPCSSSNDGRENDEELLQIIGMEALDYIKRDAAQRSSAQSQQPMRQQDHPSRRPLNSITPATASTSSLRRSRRRIVHRMNSFWSSTTGLVEV